MPEFIADLGIGAGLLGLGVSLIAGGLARGRKHTIRVEVDGEVAVAQSAAAPTKDAVHRVADEALERYEHDVAVHAV